MTEKQGHVFGAGWANCYAAAMLQLNSYFNFAFKDIEYSSVVKSHHKFMLASYMMQIAKFLALLHHNASFLNFCIII